MTIKERTAKKHSTIAQRKIIRQLSLQMITNAYYLLGNGYSELYVCQYLDISPEIMQGALKTTIEEALWERGYSKE